MEPSQITGDTEECHSNESGWTMYIGSYTEGAEDDQNEKNDDNGDEDDKNTEANHEADSDDSMVSDASSGPSHQGNQWGAVDFKHDDQELDESKYLVVKRAKQPQQKQKTETIEMEEMMFKEKKPKAPVQTSGDKVRRSLCQGNRK